MPVRDVPRRREEIAAHGGSLREGPRQPRDGSDDDEEDHERRQESSRPPRPEVSQSDASRSMELSEQQARDEEAGEDEEDVDSHEPGGGPGHPEVERKNQQNGDGPHPV